MSATFHADTMWRRVSGLSRIWSITSLIWWMCRPSGAGPHPPWEPEYGPGAPAGGGGPRPPLVAVDRAEVAVGVGPLVPDGDASVLQPLDVGVAAQEPQQLGEDRAGVHPLGRDQREAGTQVEPHLVAEH